MWYRDAGDHPVSFGFEYVCLQKLKGRLIQKFSYQGLLGRFLLGIFFALSFCPFSAVLFFGMLMSLALSSQNPIGVPLAFGFATSLPVILFSMLLVTGVKRCSYFLGRV